MKSEAGAKLLTDLFSLPIHKQRQVLQLAAAADKTALRKEVAKVEVKDVKPAAAKSIPKPRDASAGPAPAFRSRGRRGGRGSGDKAVAEPAGQHTRFE